MITDLDTEIRDFAHASDFVTFIRERFGQKFCICVAGYPEMHPRSPTKELDLSYLKAKVNFFFPNNAEFSTFRYEKM